MKSVCRTEGVGDESAAAGSEERVLRHVAASSEDGVERAAEEDVRHLTDLLRRALPHRVVLDRIRDVHRDAAERAQRVAQDEADRGVDVRDVHREHGLDVDDDAGSLEGHVLLGEAGPGQVVGRGGVEPVSRDDGVGEVVADVVRRVVQQLVAESVG